MTPILVAVACGLALALSASPTFAQDKYRVTDAEKAACQGDAQRLCSAAYPDEDALLTCMRSNMGQLTAGCRSTFVAGLRRRGIQ